MTETSLQRPQNFKPALDCAILAARKAGEVMRKNFHLSKRVTASHQHDIKLELDVRCQSLIERTLRGAFASVPVLGEEGVRGDPEADLRWVVDPIDGTVNFSYEIPHACVSIALQTRTEAARGRRRSSCAQAGREEYQTVVGVVYDPFCDELWTAVRGRPARLNGRIIRVSQRRRLGEALLSLGFAKEAQSLERMLPVFNQLVRRVRKIRLMGAAALAMVYVASGRFDAYLESGIRLWDIAAGGLILECAGGDFWREQLPGEYTYMVAANNGPLRPQLCRFIGRLIGSERV